MIRVAFIVTIALIFTSCGKDNPVISDGDLIDTTATFDDITTDTTKLLVSQLPVKVDST